MVCPETKIVVRYHDSIPLFLPHTVNGYDLKRFYWGLRASIRNGGGRTWVNMIRIDRY
jgi:hypothetical protein